MRSGSEESGTRSLLWLRSPGAASSRSLRLLDLVHACYCGAAEELGAKACKHAWQGGRGRVGGGRWPLEHLVVDPSFCEGPAGIWESL